MTDNASPPKGQRYFADGAQVRICPLKTMHADGTTSSTFGFIILTIHDNVLGQKDAAVWVAEAMNAKDALEAGKSD